MDRYDASPNATNASDPVDADVTDAWRALLEHLDTRRRELNDEVCRYPTPIARCDEQLPKLLEERAHAVRASRLAHATDDAVRNGSDADRPRRLAQFLLACERDDDARAAVLRRRLGAALANAVAGNATGEPIPEARTDRGDPMPHVETIKQQQRM